MCTFTGAGVPYKRDIDTVLATSHLSDKTDITNDTDAATLFDGNSSCVLAPEVTEGPYCKFSLPEMTLTEANVPHRCRR